MLFVVASGCAKLNSVALPYQDIDDYLVTKIDCKCKYNETRKKYPGPNDRKSLLMIIAWETYKYSIMSANAYSDSPQIIIPEWKRVERLETWKGFGVDVYLSDNRKYMVLAFRGTDGITGVNDWVFGNFVLSWNGRYAWDGQYGNADDAFEQIKYKYKIPNDHIIITGHSLGGGLAMHIALLHNGINAYVFNPSPRVFAKGDYGKHNNKIVIIEESGEILAQARKIFKTLPAIKHTTHRYNYLSGDPFKEHSMQKFSQCMYKTVMLSDLSDGCDLRMMSVSNDKDQQKIVQKFQSVFEFKRKECAVLIVSSTSVPALTHVILPPVF